MGLNKFQYILERFENKAKEIGRHLDKIDDYIKKSTRYVNRLEVFIQNNKDESEEVKKTLTEAFNDIEYKYDDLSDLVYKLDALEDAFRKFEYEIDRLENKI